jgi:hypothetical protein
VEAAGHLVALVVELAAGVENGHHDLGRRAAARMLVHRNAAAVIHNGHGVVDVQGDIDLVAEAGQRFVDRVVDDLVDEMVEPRRAGRPDEHRRPLADGFKTFENFDLVGAVLVPFHAIAVRCTRGARLRLFS